MKTTLTLATMIMTAGLSMAQVVIPDGTPVRVRLQQNLSSETAELGATIDFAVSQEVRVGDAVVIANGARATGSVVSLERRGRMGKAGHLDFSIERVQLVDGNWMNLRYTPMKNKGKGSGVTSGVLTAGLAVVFWPAAPLGLLKKGQDITIIKGRSYDVFSDESTYVASAAAASTPQVARSLPQQPTQMIRQDNGMLIANGGLSNTVATPRNTVLLSNTSFTAASPAANAPMAQEQAPQTGMLSINSNLAGADIELDGMFVGNAPATIQVPAGTHHLSVRQGAASWEHDIQVFAGNVNINATLGKATTTKASVK